eukprot:Sro37_g023330.2  (977) ;mRNA; f:104911-107841
MNEKYKQEQGLVMWKCRTCGVCVHGHCYAGLDDPRKSSPMPDFECKACESVGKSFKVREIQPFTGERLVVSQDERPRECCLCSVEDGIRAMHPVYDHHGPKGRQIYLPANPEEGRPRRLAWCHTMCAQLSSRSVCIFACLEDGSYDAGDEEENDLLPDDESDNSDLDREEDEDQGIGHWVYWGYLHRQLGKEKTHGDDWTKEMHNQKMKTGNCIFCGKDDKKMVDLNGHNVYQSLRVPLQCSANNVEAGRRELFKFRKTHRVDEPCSQPLHPGCAMWGRNDDGEYSRARRAWFLPGMTGDQDDVMECYCDMHALDLFKSNQEGCDMEKKVPGPFATIVGSPTKKKSPTSRNAIRLLDSDSESDEERGQYIRQVPRRRLGQAGRTKVTAREPKATSKAISKKAASSGKHEKAKTRVVPKKNKKNTVDPLAGNNLVIEADTNQRRLQQRQTAGDAKQIMKKKHGRLVEKRNSNTATDRTVASAKESAGEVDVDDFAFAQRLLKTLWKLKEKCEANGKAWDATVTAGVRVKQLKEYMQNGEREAFRKIWEHVMKAVNNGIRKLTVGEDDEEEELSDKHRRKKASRQQIVESDDEDEFHAVHRKKQKPAKKASRQQIVESDDEDESHAVRQKKQKPAKKASRQQIVESDNEDNHVSLHPQDSAVLEEMSSQGKPKARAVSNGPDQETTNESQQQESSVPDKRRSTQANTNAGTSTQDSVEDDKLPDSWEAIAISIANDIGAKLQQKFSTDTDTITDERTQEVTQILKDSRKRWRKICSLPIRSDYNTVWKRSAALLEAKFEWLTINSSRSNQQPAENRAETDEAASATSGRNGSASLQAAENANEADAAEASTIHASSVHGSEAASNNASNCTGRYQSAHSSEGGIVEDGHDMTTVQASPQGHSDPSGQSHREPGSALELNQENHQLPQMGQVHPPPPNPWAHLFYGPPYYKKAGYIFGEWDSYEVKEVEVNEAGEIVDS